MATRRRNLPWLTGAVCFAAFLAFLVPASFTEALALDRVPVLRGQVWRLWTGHWVHFGTLHLCWNLLAAAVACTWLEAVRPKLLLAILVLGPGIIGLVLLAACPEMTRYGGLSGLAVCVIAALGITRLRQKTSLPWLLVMLVILTKITVEFIGGTSLTGALGSTEIRNMPEAHAAGLISGVLLAFLPWREKANTSTTQDH